MGEVTLGVEGIGIGPGVLVIIKDMDKEERVLGDRDREERGIGGRREIVRITEDIMRRLRLGGRMIFGDLVSKVAIDLEVCFSCRCIYFSDDTMCFSGGIGVASYGRRELSSFART